MNIQEEIRLLEKARQRQLKGKRAKERWPADFQLRVLKLIEFGMSPQVLAKKLSIPMQTFYSWRRFWKKQAKKDLKFMEVEVESDHANSSVSAALVQLRSPRGFEITLPKEIFLELTLSGAL